MINLDEQGPRRAMPQGAGPQGQASQAAGQPAGGPQQAGGPAVLFRQPQAAGQQPQAAMGGPGQMGAAAQQQPQTQPKKPLNPLERLQAEQARLQELYGIIGQAQAQLEAVRSAMGKKPAAGTQYEQAMKGSANANR